MNKQDTQVTTTDAASDRILGWNVGRELNAEEIDAVSGAGALTGWGFVWTPGVGLGDRPHPAQ